MTIKFFIPIFLFLQIPLLSEAIFLKNKANTSYDKQYSYPKEAPMEFQKLETLPIPQAEDYLLEIPRKPGTYEAPDGGMVNVWNTEGYEWKLKSGNNFTRWNAKQWRLTVGAHEIYSALGANSLWESSVRIVFPDGVSITKHKVRKAEVAQYTYDKPGDRKTNLHFDIVHPTYWGNKQIQIGIYDITYSPTWDLTIEGLSDSEGREKFLKYMETHFGFSSNRIKVVMHSSVDNFWIYSNREVNTKDACTGWSNKSVFSLCPSPGIFLESKQNPKLDQIGKDTFEYRALLHDSIHYIQANRCELVTPAPKPTLNEPWYLEGIAEMGIMKNNAKFRAEQYSRFYNTFLKTKPSFKKGNDPNFNDYRLIGTMFLEYLSLTKGNPSIQKFYDRTCLGEKPEDAFLAEFGQSIATAYTEMYAYFQQNQNTILAQVESWSTEDLPAVTRNESQSRACSRVENMAIKMLSEISNYNDLPCFLNAYNYDLGIYGNGFEGTLKGTDSQGKFEKIFVWKTGAYSVSGKDYKVTVSEDEQQLEIGKFRIVNWKSKPDRQMIELGGKRVHCWSEKNGCSKPY